MGRTGGIQKRFRPKRFKSEAQTSRKKEGHSRSVINKCKRNADRLGGRERKSPVIDGVP